jgi:hypothetical protein
MKAIYKRAFERISKTLGNDFSQLQSYGHSVYHLLPRDDLRCLFKIRCQVIKYFFQHLETLKRKNKSLKLVKE